MNYLYGDSTPSTLRSNFLEFLRDAIDFAVFTLEADLRIRRGRDHMEALRREADAENERLRVFVGTVTRAIAEAPKGDQAKPTAECAAQLTTRCEQALETYLEAVRVKLAGDIAEAEAKEAAERAACLRALGALLVPHEPPDARSVVELALSPSGGYTASGQGESSFGLTWELDIAVPDAHFLSAPLRVDRIVPELGIHAPQLSGWISKEVKIKPQRLERLLVTEVADDKETLAFKLRTEVGSPSGFDVEVTTDEPSVSIVRVADDAKEPGATGAFEVDQEDAAKLLELGVKLRAACLEGLERRGVRSATVDAEAFESLPSFRDAITRLVAMMAPIVREISDRSLTPTELVLRRPLGNDRREEIFVTKASLREKYAALPDDLRAFFDPLALEAVGRAATAEPPPEPSIPTKRQELAPSRPPPPPEPAQAIEEVKVPPPAPAPPLAPAPPPAPSSDGALDRPSVTAQFSSEVRKSREDVIAALKRNIALIRDGKVDEGYRGFESFFQSEPFGSFRVEDQRQALQLMVLGKVPSPATEAIVDAHLAAIARLQRLVETSNSALDYEMLGVCHQVIEDTETAAKMFSKALEIERAHNPQSEMLGRLMKRASSV